MCRYPARFYSSGFVCVDGGMDQDIAYSSRTNSVSDSFAVHAEDRADRRLLPMRRVRTPIYSQIQQRILGDSYGKNKTYDVSQVRQEIMEQKGFD